MRSLKTRFTAHTTTNTGRLSLGVHARLMQEWTSLLQDRPFSPNPSVTLDFTSNSGKQFGELKEVFGCSQKSIKVVCEPHKEKTEHYRYRKYWMIKISCLSPR